MELKKTTVVDLIEVLENGAVQVRTATRVHEGPIQIGGSFSRKVIVPGDNYTDEDARVQAICKVAHTPEVIELYKASQISQGV